MTGWGLVRRSVVGESGTVRRQEPGCCGRVRLVARERIDPAWRVGNGKAGRVMTRRVDRSGKP